MGSIYEELQDSFGSVPTTCAGKELLSLLAPTSKCNHTKRRKVCGPDYNLEKGLEYCTECGIALGEGEEDVTECQHRDVFEAPNGLFACRRCCTEIELYTFKPEWRYYGASDNRVNKDPSRCHYTNGGNRGLEETFLRSKMEIAPALKKATEEKYNKVVSRLREGGGKSTVRGKRKTAIVCACLLHVYRELYGEFRTAAHIRNNFDLTQKDMSRGLQEYFRTFPNDRNSCTEPEDLLRWQMTLSGIHISHFACVRKIAEYLKQTSQNFTRSNPQSVSAAILYFYLCLNKEYKEGLGLSKKEFAKKVGLSEITINKLVNEVAKVAKCHVEI